MGNFGSNFLRGFGGTFPRTFDTSFRYGLQKQEDDAIAKKTAEYQKNQQDILSQLIHNVTIDPKSFQGGMPLIRPLSDEEKFQGYSKLSPQNQNAFEYVQRMKDAQEKKNELKKKEYQSFDGNLYGKDPVTGELSKEPILSKEKKPEKVWIKDERLGDKQNKLMGYENPEADPSDPRTRIVGGKKFTVTDHQTFDIYEKNTGGDGGNKISDGVKKSYLDYFTKQQVLLATTKAGIKKIKAKDINGEPIDVNTELTDHNKIYTEFVDNSMSESAKNWYNKLYNLTTENKQAGNPDPEDYYRYLQKTYIDGNLGNVPGKRDEWEDVDFETLIEKFKSIYGFDPKQVYQ